MKKEKVSKLWTLNYWNICIANFLMACSFNLLMPSIPLYITEQMGVPQTKTGIVLSSYAIAMLLIRPFAGFFVDMYSRKKLLLFGFFCYVAIFFGYFWATTILIFVLVRFLHGLMWGLTTVSSSTLAIDVIPSERRAEGIGYYGTFMNVAMAIGPFIAIHIYHEYSFQILLWCGIAMGILGIIAVALINAPEKPRAEKVNTPVSLDRFFLVKAWPIFINQLIICFAWGTIGPFVAQYGKEISIPNAGIFFLFWASGIIFSRIISGKLVDKGYIHYVNMTAMFIIAIAFCVFASFHNIIAFCVSGLFIGIGFGSMFPALQTLYVNMARNDQRGTANSTYLVGFDLGLSLGMLIGGYISGVFSFEALYFTAAATGIVSMFIYWTSSRVVFEKKKLR